MLSRETIKSIEKVALGVAAFTAVMLVIAALFRKFSMPVLFGAILGAVYSIVNFALLGVTIENAVSGAEKRSVGVIRISYFLRMFLTAAVVIWAIKAPYFNYVTAVIPLVFPQLVIRIIGMRTKKRSDKNDSEHQRT